MPSAFLLVTLMLLLLLPAASAEGVAGRVFEADASGEKSEAEWPCDDPLQLQPPFYRKGCFCPPPDALFLLCDILPDE